jgi:hypothetical protein
MDRGYIESLRLAYEGFFAAYTQAPVLLIDTNNLNFVQDPAVLASIRSRIRAALPFGEGTYQQTLPQFTPTMSEAERMSLAQGTRRLGDLQRWQRTSDTARGKPANLLQDFLELTQSVGALSAALGESGASRTALCWTLAACLGRLMQLANAAGVDLEEAYIAQELKR